MSHVPKLLLFTAFVVTIEARFYPSTFSQLEINERGACGISQPLTLRPNMSLGFVGFRGYAVASEEGTQVYCSWLIESPKNTQIAIKFKSFYLRGTARLCFYDGIDDNSSAINVFYETHSRNFVSVKNYLYVTYSATKSSLQNYFHFYFYHQNETIDCGEDRKLRCDDGRGCYDKMAVCDGVFDCTDGTDEQSCSANLHNSQTTCGLQPVKPEFRGAFKIYMGEKAAEGSWPWMVSIRYKHAEPEGHRCGGVVIDRQWVLTAAHCLDDFDPEDLELHFNRHHKMFQEISTVRRINKTVIPPEYEQVHTDDAMFPVADLAMLKLNAPLPESIIPLCLPSWGSNLTRKDSILGYIAGWGQTKNTGNDLLLKQARVPILGQGACRKIVPSELHLYEKFFLCAGHLDGGEDACQGDSGGPLVVNDEKTWTLLGITSIGTAHQCGSPNSVGIYTNVSYFQSFILRTKQLYS